MSPPLADRVALVTGASRGIGRATAIALARQGAHIVALARTVGGLEELDDEIKKEGSSATLVPLDLRDFDALDRLSLAWLAQTAAVAVALSDLRQRVRLTLSTALARAIGLPGPLHDRPREPRPVLARRAATH